jgi:hypothetical protein
VRGISDFIRQFRTSFSLGFDGGYCLLYGCIHIGNWEPVGATIKVSQPHDNIHIGLIVKTIGKISLVKPSIMWDILGYKS